MSDSSRPKATIKRVNHTGISVRDMERSLTFYRDLLGLELIFDSDLDDVQARGCTVVHLNGHTIALFVHDEKVYAVDNRCPHMGFPLDRGSGNTTKNRGVTPERDESAKAGQSTKESR